MKNGIKTLIALIFILGSFFIGQTIQKTKTSSETRIVKQKIDSLLNVVIDYRKKIDSLNTIKPDTVFLPLENPKVKEVPVGNNR